MAVAQQVADALWGNADSLTEVGEAFNTLTRTPSFPEPPRVVAWVPHLWGGPVGPFLVPFQAMAAARGPTCVSVYLCPHELDRAELAWFRLLRVHTSRVVADPDQPDTGAELVNQMATHAFARVLPNPWLVAVHATSPIGDLGDARSVAASVRALCLEAAPAAEDPDAPFPGASLLDPPAADAAQAAHARLEFPLWPAPPSRKDIPPRHPALVRLDYLTDARGAATAFRLPVSVRGGVPGIDVEQPSPDFIPGPRYRHPAEPAAEPPAPNRRPRGPCGSAGTRPAGPHGSTSNSCGSTAWSPGSPAAGRRRRSSTCSTSCGSTTASRCW